MKERIPLKYLNGTRSVHEIVGQLIKVGFDPVIKRHIKIAMDSTTNRAPNEALVLTKEGRCMIARCGREKQGERVSRLLVRYCFESDRRCPAH